MHRFETRRNSAGHPLLRHAAVVALALSMLLLFGGCTEIYDRGQVHAPLACMERFSLEDFALGIWRTPPESDQYSALDYFKTCEDLNLTVVKTCHNELPDHWLAAAETLGLPVIVHALKPENRAWGPDFPVADPESEAGHYARLDEFQWLYNTYGQRPGIVGYLLNDNCGLHDYTVSIAEFLLQSDPGAIPWMSTNPHPIGQAFVPMPVISSQVYPYLEVPDASPNERSLMPWQNAERGRRLAFCTDLERDRAMANRMNLAVWPLIASGFGDAGPGHVRFQLFSSLAYGAQGIWYFHCFDFLDYSHGDAWMVRPRPTALYEPIKEAHAYVVTCGRRLLGHRSLGVFHTGPDVPPGAFEPGKGEVIEELCGRVLAGILAPESAIRAGDLRPTAILFVDKRTVQRDEDPRIGIVKLGARVQTARALLPDGTIREYDLEESHEILLPPLRGGEGALLEISVAPKEGAAAPRIEAVELDSGWRLMADKGNRGVVWKWFDPGYNAERWSEVGPDRSQGWNSQVGETITGHAWYRLDMTMPEFVNLKNTYLHFGAVDEQATVYVNGEIAFEHTAEATGKGVGILWSEPFVVPLEGFAERGQPLSIAVQVRNDYAMGGMLLPVHLLAANRPLSQDEIWRAVRGDILPGG